MKSFIEPICCILETIPPASQSAADAISQFIATCELDSQILYSFSTDPKFPSLVRHLTTEAVVNMKELTGISSVSDLATSIMMFLSSLSTKHPILHELITSNTSLDDLILSFYDNYIAKSDIRNINAPLIFPFIKFFAILSSSQHVDIAQPKTLEVIFSLTASLLENPQLSAWSAAIIAGLTRNCAAAEAHLKTMPSLLQIKRDLSALFSSNDICIVCSALSATVALFPIGTDAVSALRASTHFIASDSQFQLLLPLAAASIRDLVKKAKLTEEELTTILMTALTAKGYNAFTLYHLLVDLSDFHPMITSIVKTTEYLETLFVALLSHEEEYVAESGCHMLLCLADCDPNLFHGMNETTLFSTIFASLTEIPSTEFNFRAEPFIVLLRLLFKSGPPKKSDVELLSIHEDFVFTSFLRSIENNESYLSACLFLFIQQSARYIKGWMMKVKRIVIDSAFPALVVNIINTSQNSHATQDALNILTYFCVCKEPEFFDMFISAFILLSKRSHEEKMRIIENNKRLEFQLDNIAAAKNQSDSQVEELTNINSRIVQELNDANSKSRTNNFNTEIISKDKGKEKIQKYKDEIRILKEANEKLTMKNIKQSKVNKQLKTENETIIHQLETNTNVSPIKGVNSKRTEIINKTVSEFSSNRNFQNEENESKLAAAQKIIYDDSQIISKLESELRIQKNLNEKMDKELEQLREEMKNERNRTNQLQIDIEQVEKQNVQYRTKQKDINHVKRKYATKRQQLMDKMTELEKEKGKWESIAKFYNKLCKSKGETVKEVYHVFT